MLGDQNPYSWTQAVLAICIRTAFSWSRQMVTRTHFDGHNKCWWPECMCIAQWCLKDNTESCTFSLQSFMSSASLCALCRNWWHTLHCDCRMCLWEIILWLPQSVDVFSTCFVKEGRKACFFYTSSTGWLCRSDFTCPLFRCTCLHKLDFTCPLFRCTCLHQLDFTCPLFRCTCLHQLDFTCPLFRCTCLHQLDFTCPLFKCTCLHQSWWPGPIFQGTGKTRDKIKSY